MTRTFIALALGLAAALALASTALAKEGGVELSSTPFGTPPGGTWTGTLTVIGEPVLAGVPNPSIRLTNLGTGETRTFGTKPAKVPTTAESQSFVFEVVFPTAGRYSYTVSDGVTDREYMYPPVRIVGSGAAVPVPSSGGDGSFPIWAPVVGGLALLLVTSGAGIYLRRRRFGLAH